MFSLKSTPKQVNVLRGSLCIKKFLNLHDYILLFESKPLLYVVYIFL